MAKATNDPKCLTPSLLILSSLQLHYAPCPPNTHPTIQEELGQVLIKAESFRFPSYKLLPLQGYVHGLDPWGKASVDWCKRLLTLVQPSQSPAYREAGSLAMVLFLGQNRLGDLGEVKARGLDGAALALLDILITLLQVSGQRGDGHGRRDGEALTDPPPCPFLPVG